MDIMKHVFNHDKKSITDLGTLRIENRVIASISSMAASGVDEVASVGTGINRLFQLLGLKLSPSGVKVKVDHNEIKINVPISAKYGANLPRLASLVQESVKREIERMTGLSTVEVNVDIRGVVKTETRMEVK